MSREHDGKFILSEAPVHLGLSATVVRQPTFGGGLGWYEAYVARHAADGAEGRLVSVHSFDRPWEQWEMHPQGEELVVCLSGEITLYQQIEAGARTLTLRPGEAAINPRGVWHTADVAQAATALFITAGVGTQHRAR